MKKTVPTRGIDLIKKYKNIPEPKVLWNGIIEGASGLITGVGKTGKTTFAENLAIAFASGKKEFFGFELDGKPRKVLFINLEEKPFRIVRRNKKMINSLSKEQFKNYANNYYIGREDFPEYLLEEKDWSAIRNYILQIKPEIVFLDSLTHMCIGEVEKSAVAQKFTQMFKKYFLSIDGITFFTIHHNTKGNDKPMSQDSISGSRIITQEFDFALGLGNIPTARGGNYCTMIYNKDAIKDNTKAYLYRFNQDSWVENIGSENVFNLYNDVKVDGRTDSKNKERVYDFIQSLDSQGSLTISASILQNQFVKTSTMSKQTLYTCLNKLESEDLIEKEEKGIYKLKMKKSNERDNLQSIQ
ncbi:AAA family ATPase [Tenacibaculum sp. 47A_GOM-205m]|uniref:AAA family ATPase n=1 Tax=Tenacibaculum sp. 47A_GOM-205m TaxID=1380384 RepID=UPI00048B46A7|nr:AAA family ATPase [Tenacibaculum sp. 47A_GOM-205m]